MKTYLNEIFYLLGDDKKKIPWLILLFLGVSLLDLAGLWFIGPYVALVVDPEAVISGKISQVIAQLGLPNDQQSLVIIIGVILLCIFFFKALVTIGINYQIIRFSQQRQYKLRSILMSAYLSLPYVNYLNRNSSEYIHSIQALTGQFSKSVVSNGLRSLSDGIVAIMITILLIINNGAALVVLVMLLGTSVFFYDYYFGERLQTYGKQGNKASTSMVQGIHEGIEGLKEIRILGVGNYFYEKVRLNASRFSQYQTHYQVLSDAPRYLLEFLMVGFFVLVVIGFMVFGENVKESLPVLGVFALAGIRLMPIANGFSTSLAQLRYGRDSVSRLYRDLVEVEHLKDEVLIRSEPESEPFHKLELQHIKFSYPNTDRKILNDISLNFKSGETIGCIGPSGSGKSTLIDVLLGLLDLEEGNISYNEKPLASVLDEWRSQVAYLPQQVFLIDNTLRHNIALGQEENDIDEAKLYEAIRQAQLTELVEQLPDGMDTVLGEHGVRLSGGQRQRVALSRALYYGRNVLIMDEATSALDYKTEQEIAKEIKELRGKKTIIVIAHSLTTLKHCDRIYEIDKGKIINVGSYEEILLKYENIKNHLEHGS